MQEIWKSGNFIEAHKTDWGDISLYQMDSESGLTAIADNGMNSYRIIGLPISTSDEDVSAKSYIIKNAPEPTDQSDEHTVKFLYQYPSAHKLDIYPIPIYPIYPSDGGIILSENLSNEKDVNLYFSQYWLTEYGTSEIPHGDIYEIDSSGFPRFVDMVWSDDDPYKEYTQEEVVKIIVDSRGTCTRKDIFNIFEMHDVPPLQSLKG